MALNSAPPGPVPSALPATDAWRVESYPSGTVVVTTGDPKRPYYYVWGDGPITDRDRYLMAEQLRDWLNGGQRAAWMDSLFRDAPEHVTTLAGNTIQATGPWHDLTGSGDWKMHDGDDRIARGLLINQLVAGTRP